MAASDLDLSELALDDLLALAEGEAAVVNTVPASAPSTRIAIIGMAGRVGGCADLESFWQMLRAGGNALADLDQARRADLMEFLDLKGALPWIGEEHFLRASFLKEIDAFDHQFFGMAKQEADLTDPNQRLFIQTAWAALEQAGYGGDSVKGSATGIFVGFSSDFGEDYRRLVGTLAPDAPEVAVAGNVKSIIASRLAYHLDLRGPSLLVDTACSSGLVAVHLACRALRNGDCEMALAGAVKLDLVPVAEVPEAGVGIKDIRDTAASDGRTRTFDDACEGTSAAEGVLAFVLKPLDKAIADGDTIHAVICGSAVNQDGRSVGITAPNSAAQEQLILAALQDAGVHPESVSYIEAHGTATRLGDPIEINGIQRAFRHHSRRRQFCAVGSVKTNIGHMDNAAGLAGLAKTILAMRHGELPPSLNFTRPNRKIAFEHSPVYVNDTLRPWQAEPNRPLRAGINSFGLSGTNCHLVLESPPPLAEAEAVQGPYFLPLSAFTGATLRELAEAYRSWLAGYLGPASDLCLTAALGRLHHPHRLAFAFEDLEELKTLLEGFLAGTQLPAAAMAIGSFRLVGDNKDRRRPGDITDAERSLLSQQAEALARRYRQAETAGKKALLAEAIGLYARGADFPWGLWYEGWPSCRIPLPTYPFARTRCWVEPTPAARRLANRQPAAKAIAHPLLDRRTAQTLGFQLYQSELGADSHWELAEHKIGGAYVLPGTAFLEMILEVAAQMGQARPLSVEQLVFLHPLVLAEGERREIHIQAEGQDGAYKLRIASPSSAAPEGWELHAEAALGACEAEPGPALAVADVQARLGQALHFARQDDVARGLDIGDRWNLSFQQGWTDEAGDEFLVSLALPEQYRAETGQYHCHPALLDTAVNAANHLLGENSLYLPLSYRRLEFHRSLPAECLVHLRKKIPGQRTGETFSFDIDLTDTEGAVCGRIFDYTVKRVAEPARLGASTGQDSQRHVVSLVPRPPLPESQEAPAGPILLVRRDTQSHAGIAAALRGQGAEVIEWVKDWTADGQTVAWEGQQAPGYGEAFERVEAERFGGVVYAVAEPQTGEGLAVDCREDAQDFFDFLTAFVRKKPRSASPVLVLAAGAFSRAGQALAPAPHAAALAGLARVAELEFPQLRIRCLDSDRLPDAGLLLAELADETGGSLSLYREGERYSERLVSLPPVKPGGFSPRGEGVYVITGGTGSLGLELAAHWAGQGPVNLALIGSKPLPPRDTWEALLESGADAKTQRQLGKLLELEATEARIEYLAADVADYVAMDGVMLRLRERYGRINGVIHAAGRAGEGFLLNKTPERLEAVLRPKIDGAWNLHSLTLGDPLDFFLMFSSIATVLRNPGQADYTAANAYLDSLAHFRRNVGLPALSVRWPAWRDTGMAVEYGAVDEAELIAPIGTAEALRLLDAALADAADLPPVLILGAINPRAALDQVEPLGLDLSEPIRRRLQKPAATAKGSAVGGEVVLKGLDAPDDIDRAVAGLWGKILGAKELDADDVFSELGGNSILTTQLYREYEVLYPGIMELADLFTRATIREQAEHIRAALGRGKPKVAAEQAETDMDRVLAMLASGEISAEEAQSILGG